MKKLGALVLGAGMVLSMGAAANSCESDGPATKSVQTLRNGSHRVTASRTGVWVAPGGQFCGYTIVWRSGARRSYKGSERKQTVTLNSKSHSRFNTNGCGTWRKAESR